MKVGDLVELSAKGHSLWYCEHAHDKIGIVVEVRPKKDKVMYPITVTWMGGRVRTKHLRSNLKFVSKG